MSILNIEEIISLLKSRYQVPRFQDDPFKILIATMFSQRTRDETAREAAERLFCFYASSQKISQGKISHAEQLIMPVNFYRQKVKKIIAICQILEKTYNGKIPQDPPTPLHLPGVGRKTANCVMMYGYGKRAFPVDTHIHRVANRLGLVMTQNPE